MRMVECRETNMLRITVIRYLLFTIVNDFHWYVDFNLPCSEPFEDQLISRRALPVNIKTLNTKTKCDGIEIFPSF